MAKIYQKTIATGTDKCLILDPREALSYPFNIGNNWTEARLGFFLSLCNASGDNVAPVNEIVTANTVSNRFAVGLKDASDNLPGTAGAQFWGLMPTSTSDTVDLNANPNLSALNRTCLVDGTTVKTQSSSFWGYTYMNAPVAATTNFAYFLGLKFRITNRGLANQTVSIDYQTGSTATSDTSIASLRSRLVGFTANAESSLSGGVWNNNPIVLPIPDCIYLRYPFANNRVRIHSLMIEKFA